MSEKLPEILVLKALEPVQKRAGRLEYPNLDSLVEDYGAYDGELWREFVDAPVDSLDERRYARRIAKLCLLKTSQSAISSSPEYSDIWADRFTEAGEELYDTEIDFDTWQSLFNKSLVDIAKDPNAKSMDKMDLYDKFIALGFDGRLDLSAESEIPRVHPEWQSIFMQKFGLILNRIDHRNYPPRKIADLFADTLQITRKSEEGWKVHQDTDLTNIRVNSSQMIVTIGTAIEKATYEEARGTLAHEILTHVLRSQTGKNSQGDIVIGLSDYSEAEEGLAIINEAIASGRIPDKVVDRYVDIGIAKGMLGITPTRQEMIDIARTRAVVRKPSIKNGPASKLAINHINRIYRGGPGNIVKGLKQPIFTKDATYFNGYMRMVRYINAQIESGVTAEDLFDYLYLGKFDPTRESHVAYVKQVTGKELFPQQG